MITQTLQTIVEVYRTIYPDRDVGLINRMTRDKSTDWSTLLDSGICFGVAIMVKDYLSMHHQNASIIYIYRRYDAEEGDGFEDVLVHAVLECNGKFYDTDDVGGVCEFKDLSYIRNFDGLGVRDHYFTYPEREDLCTRDSVPNTISEILFSAINRRLNTTITRRSLF